jgi:phospholipid/cholesterol/gamma-HCH transport system substrate-binding protein
LKITRLRHALIGLLAIALVAGLVALTGLTLTGAVGARTVTAYADFEVCGQGIRPGGDVKERGVLVGRIGKIERVEGVCRIQLDLKPDSIAQIPANVGAQVRAKTIFGEKWVELLYPDEPDGETIAADDIIPKDRTIDPLEVETILNVALPLLDAIDPEHLAGALEALASGFVGHEDAAIKGIEKGIEALQPLNDNKDLVAAGIDQLANSSEVLARVDDDLLRSLGNLDDLDRWTIDNQELIRTNLQKTPELLGELTDLFEARFVDITKIVDRGATVIGVLAARQGDLDHLLNSLPKFNSLWIRNLDAVCRYRQATDEQGAAVGDEVPGRCWRVHNLISDTRGPYAPGEEPRPGHTLDKNRERGPISLSELLFMPVQGGRG